MRATNTRSGLAWAWCGIAATILMLGGSTPATAFTAAQATNMWNAYNNAFYVGNGGNAYYNFEQGGSLNTTAFWTNAEEIEMAVDRAQRSGASGDKTIVTALVNGFDKTYGSDWTSDTFNDDIMWACIAHLRAYFVTGSTNTTWATEAANNFNWVYNGGHSPGRVQAQVDSTFGGGMWWTTDHGTDANATKNACVNGPAAIVGYYLSTIWPTGTGFLSQAQALYNWEASTLVNSAGYVYDHIGPAGTGVTGYDLSYNAGTFLGAAYLLGHSSEAGLAATNYMVDECNSGLLPNWGTGGGNNDGFNGIFLRWMALYMTGSGTQSTYSNWLYLNADAALQVANATGQSWDNWTAMTASSGLYSWDCSSSVVAVNCIPPNNLVNGVHSLTPACASGSRLDDSSGGTTDGNKIQIWAAADNVNQQWSFANIGGSSWNIAVNLGPYCIDGGKATSGTALQIYSCNGTNDQNWVSAAGGVSGDWTFSSKQSGLCIDVNGAGSANGTVVQSYTCNNSSAQNWAVN